MDPSYNDSFGSFDNNGDIVVSSGGSNTRKHRFVVPVIIGLIAIAIVTVVLVLFLKNKDGGSSANVDAIDRYKNYIIAGDEKSTETDAYYEVGNIYFREVYYYGEDSDWENYYNRANELLDSIGKINDKASSIASRHKLFLKLFYKDKKIKDDRINVLAEQYINGGKYNLTQYLDSNFGDLKKSSSEYLVDYYNRVSEIGDLIAEYVDSMGKADCFGSSLSELEECVSLAGVDDSESKGIRNSISIKNADLGYITPEIISYYVGIVHDLDKGIINEEN